MDITEAAASKIGRFGSYAMFMNIRRLANRQPVHRYRKRKGPTR